MLATSIKNVHFVGEIEEESGGGYEEETEPEASTGEHDPSHAGHIGGERQYRPHVRIHRQKHHPVSHT